ncbi:FkbM family methyltransferase [Synechocystis sp. FACHB-383]|uniref:FkbM family methyltransferase n=1 Tax=Synechocystis sp. FACHB-383 TaxID=2692864 RepID=UPI001683793F|nr:FkbM family methyltransferase [Synechocystis sp. FACHB-383]MBD2654457.1 FkbM family methyltransferase [Synechocystis sp. FACHB-383]
MKKLVENFVALFTSKFLSLLRNHQNISLSREEFRALNLSFSSYGEDLVVLSYFKWYGHEDKDANNRVYVDVGAYHPANLSTTLLLHKAGWRGVNIDLDPEKIELFKKTRPQDHNVVAAVSDKRRIVRHLKYPLGTTNRIGEIEEINLTSICQEDPLEVSEIETVTLTEIMDNSPFRDCKIDYLNVDCEGHDLEVLKGLDYNRYPPNIITVEAHTEEEREKLNILLNPLGYEMTAVLRYTLVFIQNS